MFLSNWITNHFGQAFPWGTMIVNVSGCLIIGIFAVTTSAINLSENAGLRRYAAGIISFSCTRAPADLFRKN